MTQSFIGPVIGYKQMIMVKSRNRIHAYAGFRQTSRRKRGEGGDSPRLLQCTTDRVHDTARQKVHRRLAAELIARAAFDQA
jgi:hypothetical protein